MSTESSQQHRLRIGGMALENGVLFQTDRNWTLAVRDERGEIQVDSGRKLGLGRSPKIKKVPLLRGIVNLGETVLLLPQVYARGGKLPLPVDSPQVLASVLVTLCGTLLLKNPKRRFSPLFEEVMASALALLPSLVALRKTNATEYHAAEHKSINAYERFGDVAQQQARDARAEHVRCGSNIVGPALVMMTIGNVVMRRTMGRQSHVARVGVSLISLTGAIELVQWAARHPRSPWSQLFTKPGGSLQNLVTTSDPSDEQLAVGLAALKELLRIEGAVA